MVGNAVRALGRATSDKAIPAARGTRAISSCGDMPPKRSRTFYRPKISFSSAAKSPEVTRCGIEALVPQLPLDCVRAFEKEQDDRIWPLGLATAAGRGVCLLTVHPSPE